MKSELKRFDGKTVLKGQNQVKGKAITDPFLPKLGIILCLIFKYLGDVIFISASYAISTGKQLLILCVCYVQINLCICKHFSFVFDAKYVSF